VNVAVAVTTLESVLVAMAVMVVVPLLTAVASPPAEIVATWALLELQVTVPVKSSVAPEVVVPMAMNWLVCVGEATDCVPGMMASDARLPPVVPPPPVTVMVAVVLIDPGSAAVMVAVPAETAVAMPEEFTVATAGVLDDQVACAVTLEELGGWLPCWTIPVAENWTVCPTARDDVDGLIWIEPTSVLLQPANGNTTQSTTAALKQYRVNILLLLACLVDFGRVVAQRSLSVTTKHEYSPHHRLTARAGESVNRAQALLRNQVG
jgi:hypothetical protein